MYEHQSVYIYISRIYASKYSTSSSRPSLHHLIMVMGATFGNGHGAGMDGAWRIGLFASRRTTLKALLLKPSNFVGEVSAFVCVWCALRLSSTSRHDDFFVSGPFLGNLFSLSLSLFFWFASLAAEPSNRMH